MLIAYRTTKHGVVIEHKPTGLVYRYRYRYYYDADRALARLSRALNPDRDLRDSFVVSADNATLVS